MEKIKVHGFVMLKGLNNGKTYTIKDDGLYRDRETYRVGRYRFYKSSINMWINHKKIEPSTYNYIEVLK